MSGLRAGVHDLGGTPLATRSTDIAIGTGPDHVLNALVAQLDSLLAEAGRDRGDVLGIGVGMPGHIELETARGSSGTAGPPWGPYPVEQHLTSAFGVPVFVGRAASLLALAEHRAFHPEARVLLAVKAGTVIECGIVIDGHVVAGGSDLAGEIGHTPLSGQDALCVCGNRGCLNAVAGGGALADHLAALGYPVDSAREVARLARDGVVAAGQAVRESGRHIGEVLAGAVNLLNPDVVVVWGYLADAGDQLFAGMHESLFKLGVPAATRHVRVEYTRLGDDAGIRGAAVTATEAALSADAVDGMLSAWHASRSGVVLTT